MAYVTKPALLPSDFGFPSAPQASEPVKEKVPKKKPRPKKKKKKPTSVKSASPGKPKSIQKKRKLPWKT